MLVVLNTSACRKKAQEFCCRSILGIDIDSVRVEDASWNPRKAVRLKIAGNKPAKSPKLDDEDHAGNSENRVNVLSNEDRKEISKEISSLEQSDLFDIVSFK